MERTVTLLVKTNLTLVLTGSELRDFMSIHVVNVQKKDALYKALCVNVLQVANLIAHTLIAQLLAMNQFPVEAVHMFQEVVNTTRDWIVLKISLVRHVQKELQKTVLVRLTFKHRLNREILLKPSN